MNARPRPVTFPRVADGFQPAWSWEGQRLTHAYEARLEYLFNAISLFPNWTPAIEFEGSEDGEAVVAYYQDTSKWRYLFAIENPAEQEWVDQLIAADQRCGVACEEPDTAETEVVLGMAVAKDGLFAHLQRELPDTF
ncbi:hypothetical protein NXS08_06415 [Gleimia sp. 6138-11-ORH1]|uniref:hypothetical protein n=1 Tax=Gleimia sp. 6138-11-ORH1 TaxID=2973937 RepID=UPI002169D800|nr:hypothetical protein [Gleimia sp. 6138-11-ORH1]MCS4485099.1 hypothetical protein [Gleimia sp. 6138-11-ORH1]